jgi:probable HAF family extracellular repeat protein
MRGKRVLLSLLLLVPAFAVRASDKPLLIELDRRDSALPGGVSASGAVVAGSFTTLGGFYWMPTTGVVFIGGLGASTVSRDGSTIVGTALDSRGLVNAAIWQRAAEWKVLGSLRPGAAGCGLSLSSAGDTSRDGRVVVGLAWDGCTIARAFRWEESTGMVDLGTSVPGQSTLAAGVSADGKVVVGYQEDATGFRKAARWADGKQELLPGPEGFVGTANAANLDGTIVVGRICAPSSFRVNDPNVQSAWVWTRPAGTRCLPAPRFRPNVGPPINVAANATSDDGRVIGGEQGIGTDDTEAIIWIDQQPYYLKEYLQSHGVPNAFATWINTGAITDVSPDGRILVGKGAALGGFRGYIVILGDQR